jgi:uncharacterized protein (DUF2237 family)
MEQAKNVFGEALETCCFSPRTGFYRTGSCETGPMDAGRHVVCAEVTDEFLQFSRSRGNDLTRAVPEAGFPGLSAGDRWCLCAGRWEEARRAGVAPPVFLAATHANALETIPMSELKAHARDLH